MLYLARRLYLPTGEVLERYVVKSGGGGPLEWFPFEKENHSMILVDELYIQKNDDGVLTIGEIASI